MSQGPPPCEILKDAYRIRCFTLPHASHSFVLVVFNWYYSSYVGTIHLTVYWYYPSYCILVLFILYWYYSSYIGTIHPILVLFILYWYYSSYICTIHPILVLFILYWYYSSYIGTTNSSYPQSALVGPVRVLKVFVSRTGHPRHN